MELKQFIGLLPTSWQHCWCTTSGCRRRLPSLCRMMRLQSPCSPFACWTGWSQCPRQVQVQVSPISKWLVQHTELVTACCVRIQSSSHIYPTKLQQAKLSSISHLSNLCYENEISGLSTISNLFSVPGRRGPEYSSSTVTKAHECLFKPRSVLDSTWNNRRTLQNQTLSIRSWKDCAARKAVPEVNSAYPQPELFQGFCQSVWCYQKYCRSMQ